MTRTPPPKLRQIRTRSAIQSVRASPLPTAGDADADTECSGENEDMCLDQKQENGRENGGIPDSKGSEVTEVNKDNESGENDTAVSTQLGSHNTKEVGKLDSSVYQPFGSMTSISRSSSDLSGSSQSSDIAICRGGPGKPDCGRQVSEGDKAVQCDKCQAWFHSKCQAIPKQAHDALVKFKCLSWLCKTCKKDVAEIREMPHSGSERGEDIKRLELKVHDISVMVKEHMKVIVQSIKEQEKVVSDTAKLQERSFREQHSQRITYAEMVRGSCDKVVKEVGAKIDTLPPQTRPTPKDTTETTKAISQVFDSFMDKEKRKLNVVVHNLPEQEGDSLPERMEKDQHLFAEVIKEGMNLVVRPTKAFRVGK